jgi:uncharacterized membrane protein
MPYGIGFGNMLTYVIVIQILFFVVTIALILWFVKNSNQKEIQTPEKILHLRLASGEISKKEYNSLFKVINNKEV